MWKVGASPKKPVRKVQRAGASLKRPVKKEQRAEASPKKPVKKTVVFPKNLKLGTQRARKEQRAEASPKKPAKKMAVSQKNLKKPKNNPKTNSSSKSLKTHKTLLPYLILF